MLVLSLLLISEYSINGEDMKYVLLVLVVSFVTISGQLFAKEDGRYTLLSTMLDIEFDFTGFEQRYAQEQQPSVLVQHITYFSKCKRGTVFPGPGNGQNKKISIKETQIEGGFLSFLSEIRQGICSYGENGHRITLDIEGHQKVRNGSSTYNQRTGVTTYNTGTRFIVMLDKRYDSCGSEDGISVVCTANGKSSFKCIDSETKSMQIFCNYDKFKINMKLVD